MHSGKDKPIRNRHHWIFSGAIKYAPQFEDGDILPVHDSHTQLLGYAYFNNNSSISGRMLSFGSTKPLIAVKQNIQSAYTLRQQLVKTDTNAYRLINSEADHIPGLIVDIYNNVAVFQVGTKGIDKLKLQIAEMVIEVTGVESVFEKSDMPSRRQEGLEDAVGTILGKEITSAEIKEHGIKFGIDLVNSHKTGFYLDQRNMRQLIGNLSNSKRVLNCFGYTGGFALYAAKNGATKVVNLDISPEVNAQAKENFKLNDLDPDSSQFEFVSQDVFTYLREQDLDYDIVILDPPAFAKKRTDIPAASRGYRDINRVAISKMPAGSLLLTCSCSYHIDKEMFSKLVFQAAADTNRQVRIVQEHHLAMDHPVNVFHPETDYLKSLLLYIS